ncbi:MAG: hypothetical protein LUD50_02590 [Clostridia bacterium]|nr:hypothetical protein [Clostridia bacterium]
MTVDWLTMNRHFVEESECRPKDLEKVCEEEDNAEDEDDSMVNDFISATQPAVDWMNEYGDPHGKIIVTDEGAEYLVGEIGTGRHEEE